MKRILCVANWSEGRRREVLDAMRRAMRVGADGRELGVKVHYERADFDHNRAVTAFSGQPKEVRNALFSVAAVAFGHIDMRRHEGAHPRIGALDVCPFVVLGNSISEARAVAYSRAVGRELARRYELPVFLYEKSETGRHAKDLPTLRAGAFEGLLDKEIEADYGPRRAHPRLGASVLGVRDWLLAFNVNLDDAGGGAAKKIARRIRELRGSDARFVGVRALGFFLPGRAIGQVSLNLTQPDRTPVDPIVDWIEAEVKAEGASVAGTELVGVIRPRDLPTARRLEARPEQVIEP